MSVAQHIRSVCIVLGLLSATGAVAQTSDSSLVLTKDPTTAVLLSLPLPGLGQYYTENYWKIPLFTGGCAASAYLFFKNHTDFVTTSDLYDKAVADGADPTITSRLLDQREAFRNNRDLSGVIFLAIYTLAAIDAYVGAHLYDFDVSDSLTMGIGPSPTQIAALHVRLTW
jgi:hypothetical protein